MDHKKSRINNFSAGSLILVALLLDLVSLIPVVNIVSSFLAILIFGVWFYILGVGFINPKRFATAIIALVVEMVPVISWLPGLTAAVIATVIMVKSEDRLGIKIPSIGAK